MYEAIRTTPPATRRGGQKALALVAAVLVIGGSLYASREGSPAPARAVGGQQDQKAAATPGAVAAATAFLDALDATLREKALYEFASGKKPNWSNLPVTMVPRNGVRLGDLTKEQRTLALAAVAAVLSKGGYQKVVDIMDGDQQLAEGRGGRGRGGRGGS